MNVTLMDYFPILELPEEIQALVVERVAGNSFTDLYGLRASCKTMKALAEQSRVNHFYDVLSVPRRLNMPPELFKTCYAERNPSTLYMKGVQFFFTFNLQEEGLAFMKLAADEGYERAVESVVRIGKLVRSLKWAWVCGTVTSFWQRGTSSFQPLFLCSIVANVFPLWSEIGSCGTLKTVRMTKCVTAVSGSKSWGSSSVSLNR
ncbi:hypothetical protein DY000_02039076 [Brassica cretica]|uniref:F-box domain-containing protein n=1 Tax=Brassica cretica TaxID=69181 RepID=A0ABQ7BG84_BRACR|nr:hypothetical protein DY000_02039076 [Brassica cretica]